MLKNSKAIGYIPALDGIRAFAVIIVMLHHLFVSKYFEYGWVGVQIFFVLSGFLITSILLESKSCDNYFSAFYMRRSLRIFPIYYLVMVFVVTLAYLRQESFEDFYHFFFYLQNHKIGLSDKPINFPMMFNHTWSLAVEEQFYLIWPLIIWLTPKQNLLKLMMGLIVISLAVKFHLAMTLAVVKFNYMNTLSNLDTLVVGSLLAVMLKKGMIEKTFRLSIVISIVATAIYFSLIFMGVIEDFWNHPVKLGSMNWVIFYIWLVPLIVVLLLSIILYENKYTKAILTNKLALYIGKISYGLYLYHYSLYHSLEKLCPSLRDSFLPMSVYKILGSFIIAIISWHLVELPLLALKKRFSYKKSKKQEPVFA